MSASIVLSYRAGKGTARYDNLIASLRWLARTPHYEVIIVEQDEVPMLPPALPHPNCRLAFAYNPGAFNKAWGFNVGARLSAQPVLVFSDADLIIDGMLDRIVAHCLQQYAVAKPYRRLVDLSPEQSAQVRAGAYDWQPPAGKQHRESIGEFLVLCSGMFAMRSAVFHELGGWDERFRGWGGEDDAFSHVIQRARLPTIEFDERPALHLWHPRETAQLTGHAHYHENCALLDRVRHYTALELSRFAEVNRQVIGHSQKYRPSVFES